MERLGSSAALEAIKGPAEKGGRPFKDGVAEALVVDLSQSRLADQDKTFTGEFVETVQLQIVCLQLWESLRNVESRPITMKELKELGDTNRTLEKFYDDGVKRVVERTSVTEGLIRRWFGETLITPSRIRAQVPQGLLKSGGLPSRVVDPLLSEMHLIRVEEARGGKWIELAHDRFIDPILESNKRFQLLRGYSFLSTAAKKWHDNNEDESFLFRGRRLNEAQKFYDENKDSLGTLEGDFLSASSKLAVKLSRGIIGTLILFLIVVVWFAFKTSTETGRARDAAVLADAAREQAEEARQKLEVQLEKYKSLAKNYLAEVDLQNGVTGDVDQKAIDLSVDANTKR